MKLFEPKVYYCEIRKKYFHIENGREFVRISHVLDSICQPFDGEMIASNIAKGGKQTKKEVLDDWDATANEGTRVHNNIQHYSSFAKVIPGNEELLELCQDIHKEYISYYQSFSELTLFDEEVMWAGTTDRTNIISNRKTSMFDMEDYKRPKEGVIKDFSKQNQKMKPPFDYLENCPFVRYSFQLSIYAFMFERLTGMKPRRLGIRLILPNNREHKYIPVMYMKPEVEHIFRERKKQLISNGQQQLQTVG